MVVRGSPEGNRFTAFLLDGERIVGAAFVNDGRNVRPVRQAIDRGARVDRRRLADPDTHLRDAIAATAA